MKCSPLIAAFALLGCSAARPFEPGNVAKEGRSAAAVAPITGRDPETPGGRDGGPETLRGRPVRSPGIPTSGGAEAEPAGAAAGAGGGGAATRAPAGSGTRPARTIEPRYIGMHIGGGPNDKATKGPFERTLREAFDDIARCCDRGPCRTGTFGVDILVPKEGGPAEITNPRTTQPEEVTRCIVRAFGKLQFASPKLGRTRLSYSIRLDPASP